MQRAAPQRAFWDNGKGSLQNKAGLLKRPIYDKPDKANDQDSASYDRSNYPV